MSLKNKLLRRRGTGCLPSDIPCTDADIDRVGLVAASKVEDVDNMPFLRVLRDQHSANCCVGKGIAGMIDVHTKASPWPDDYEPASSLHIYRHARGGFTTKVNDTGTSVRNGFEAVATHGFADESTHPFSDGVRYVNKYPGPGAMRSAHARDGVKWAWIKDAGLARVAPICAALASRPVPYPVCVRTPVSKSWGNGEPYRLDARVLDTEAIQGWHLTFLLDFTYVKGLGFIFRDINSWGTDFKLRGTVLMTEDYIAHPLVGDIGILYGLDRVLERIANESLR